MRLQFKRDLANGGLPYRDARTSDAEIFREQSRARLKLYLTRESLRFILNQNLIY